MSPVLIELCLLLLPMQSDPVRAHEIQARTIVASSEVSQAQAPAPVSQQKKQFEERFNRLTQAVAEFSQEYNKNQGLTWPKDKADALKKAIHDLEAAEPALRH